MNASERLKWYALHSRLHLITRSVINGSPSPPALASSIDTYCRAQPSHLLANERSILSSRIAETIRGCKSVVEDYVRVMADLKSQSNACLEVSRLPDELFEEVFWQTVFQPGGSKNVVRTSHVCRRWRAVALRSPRLWSHITWTEGPPPTLDGLHAFLRRSHPSPLTVALRENRGFWNLNDAGELVAKYLFSIILRELPRMRSLTLGNSNRALLRSQLPKPPALLLQHIRIDVESCENVEADATALLAHFSSLQFVEASCFFPCQVLSLAQPTVTKFVLRNPWKIQSMVPPSSQLLGLLRQMPYLEDLEWDVQSIPSRHSEFGSPAVILSRLRKIKLMGRVDNLIELLHGLRIPSSANVQIGFLYPDTNSQAFADTLKSLWSSKRGAITEELASVASIEQCKMQSEFVRMWPAVNRRDDGLQNVHDLKAHYVVHPSESAVSGYLQLLNSTFSASGFGDLTFPVTGIRVGNWVVERLKHDSSPDFFKTRDLISCLRRLGLEALESLCLQHWDASALKILHTQLNRVGSGEPLLQNLKELLLLQMPFDLVATGNTAPNIKRHSKTSGLREGLSTLRDALCILQTLTHAHKEGREIVVYIQPSGELAKEMRSVLDLPGLKVTWL